MKKIIVSSKPWGDPYPCGNFTSVFIGGKEIGSIVGEVEENDVKDLVTEVYKLGLHDGKKSDLEMEVIGKICTGATKCVKSYEKILSQKGGNSVRRKKQSEM